MDKYNEWNARHEGQLAAVLTRVNNAKGLVENYCGSCPDC